MLFWVIIWVNSKIYEEETIIQHYNFSSFFKHDELLKLLKEKLTPEIVKEIVLKPKDEEAQYAVYDATNTVVREEPSSSHL